MSGELGCNGFPVSLNYFTALPDVNSLADANLAVVFKGMMKRDAITKERAVNDMVGLFKDATPGTGVFEDDAVVAWIQLYPKLAIDNARQVRGGAHQVMSLYVSQGGKAMAKYMKSFVGVWLAGGFDGDRTVARQANEGLRAAFGGDETKIAQLWRLFWSQVVNYGASVVEVETQDSLSDKRYVKPDDACAKYQRTVQTAVRMLDEVWKDQDEARPEIEQIIASEPLWEAVEAALSDAAWCGPLFKAVISLSLRILETPEHSSSSVKAVAKSVVKHVKFKAKNQVTMAQVIVEFWDFLVRVSGVTGKKSFWSYAGSKAPTKVVEWLKVGPCNSDPIYFAIVSKFFSTLHERDEVIDFGDAETGAVIVKVLLKQFSGLSTAGFVAKATKCVVQVGALFDIGEATQQIILYTCIDAAANCRQLAGSAVVIHDSLIGYGAPKSLVAALVDSVFTEKPSNIEVAGYKFKAPADRVITAVTLLYPECHLVDEVIKRVVHDNAEASDTVFALVTNAVDRGFKDTSEFNEIAPSFITTSFYNPPVDYLLRSLSKMEVKPSVVNDYFFKITNELPSKRAEFLEQVSKHIDLYDERANYVDEYAFIHELALKKKISSEESALVYRYAAKDKEISERVVQNSGKSNEKLLEFIQHNPEAARSGDVDKLLDVAWSNVEDGAVRNFLAQVASTQVITSLFAWLETAPEPNYKGIGAALTSVDKSPFYDEIMNRIKRACDQLSLVGLSISNSLEANIYLVESAATTDVLDAVILKYAALMPYVEAPWYVVGLLKEYVSDYNFLCESASTEISLQFQTPCDIASDFFADKTPLSVYLNDNTHFAYHCARVLFPPVAAEVDKWDQAKFQEVAAPSTWQKMNPLKLAVAISSATKFLTALERVQNYLFAEMLAPNTELRQRLTTITLAINFLVEQAALVPPHRLNMAIKEVGRWLESSISYDEEFIPMRVQITRFVIGVINTQENADIIEVAGQLVDDNLAICSTEPSQTHLRYFTLRLITTLKTHNQDVDMNDVADLLLSSTVNEYDSSHTNQAVAMCHQAVERIYLTNDVSGDATKYFDLLKATASVAIQRICYGVLSRLITASQQDYVVEFQLDKSPDKKAQLPQVLLDILVESDPSPYTLEDESPVMSRWCWAWRLVFCYLADITFAMRSNYLDQLKSYNLIEPMLTTIFDEVYDFGILKSSVFSLDTLPTYNHKLGATADFQEELAFLLLHLYYESCSAFGPQVQSWFKGIRDLQLKKRVDKFTSTHVSPVLIGEILDEVAKRVPSLETDDNLKIKVNRVSHEVKSTYVIDEQTMEMVIKLPTIYPLENVVVEGPLRLGVKEKQWRAWLMAAQSVVSLTNGSVTDAIEVFNRNVTLHFSGFEDCAICYSILHQDLSLPSKSCPTCNNKFHAACLYKWFKSSGTSSCPMCRGQFNFRKAN
ncbi:E3 ubiquitin-protein ligase listerin [Diutina catenulata]